MADRNSDHGFTAQLWTLEDSIKPQESRVKEVQIRKTLKPDFSVPCGVFILYPRKHLSDNLCLLAYHFPTSAMKNFILTTVLFASSILGLDLTFVSDANCTGRAFYGRQDLPSISCYDMSYLDPTDSVIVANVSSGERVTFFSDTACQNQLYSTGTNVCYTESDSQVRSFQVRTADTPAAEDDAASTSTDVVPYGVRLSNYKGLSQAGPDSINIMLSQFAIGIIVGVTAQLVALSAIATGCALTD